MSFWTDDSVRQLKTLWKRGYTASEIATRLGYTRNAVLGKAHRLRTQEPGIRFRRLTSSYKREVV